MKKPATIPSFTYENTSDENIKRFCDRNGNWTHYWLVKEKMFVKSVTHILQLGFAKGPRFHEYLLSVSKEEAKKKLEAAGDEGSRTHDAIAQLIGGVRVTMNTKFKSDLRDGTQTTLNNDEWDNLQAFENWCAVYKPRKIAQEETIAGIDYAGTFDALMVITVPEGDKRFRKELWGKDVLIMMDWKTSAAIYDEYKVQIASYWFGMRYRHKFAKIVAPYFYGMCFTGVLRIGSRHASGFEFQVWDYGQTQENYDAFRAAKMIADTVEPDFEPKIEQIKTEYFIDIPRVEVPDLKKPTVNTEMEKNKLSKPKRKPRAKKTEQK
jgi:hypothetical protein